MNKGEKLLLIADLKVGINVIDTTDSTSIRNSIDNRGLSKYYDVDISQETINQGTLMEALVTVVSVQNKSLII